MIERSFADSACHGAGASPCPETACRQVKLGPDGDPGGVLAEAKRPRLQWIFGLFKRPEDESF